MVMVTSLCKVNTLVSTWRGLGDRGSNSVVLSDLDGRQRKYRARRKESKRVRVGSVVSEET